MPAAFTQGNRFMDKLAYSTNGNQPRCPRCKEFQVNCQCVPDSPVNTKAITAILRIEKSGRAGKTVSVVAKLPANESFLKELCTELKTRCGAGGTFGVKEREGFIEIQGDKREQIRQVLIKRGYQVKG